MSDACKHELATSYDTHPPTVVCCACHKTLSPKLRCERCGGTGMFRTSDPNDKPIPCPGCTVVSPEKS